MFFCRYTSILDDDNENLLRSVIETNIFGLLLCTKEAFKLMKTRDGYGFIININSIVGHKVPFIAGVKPFSNIYSGTKHAVTAATEVLRQELIFMKNDRIRVSVSFQGMISSNQLKNLLFLTYRVSVQEWWLLSFVTLLVSQTIQPLRTVTWLL
jgi:NADP+-dependent farnesol dehydrogenase